MKLFLAGRNDRNHIIPFLSELGKEGGPNENFWRGGESRHWIQDVVSPSKENKYMKMFLTGNGIWRNQRLYNKEIIKHKPFILESFYYVDNDTERLLPLYGDFLLDSGAFTFMTNSHKTNVKWEEYIERYAEFIKKNNVEKFFELDIDTVVGYEKVIKYRKQLEDKVGRQCIPVWHKNRGIEDYKKTCQEYKYVAIGGIAIGEIQKKQYSIFSGLIREAHKHNCKVHGLGFTVLALLEKYHFDSVDSTAWTTGNRFGYIYHFTGTTIEKHYPPEGKKLDGKKVALHNYIEWIKFQRYAEKYL